jgi:hypothetical protein
MAGRICFAAILLGAFVFAAGCGGSGGGAPKVTLTDTSCTYSGAPTHEPGLFDIEAENTTSHFASFRFLELAPGISIDGVRQAYVRIMAALNRGDDPTNVPDLYGVTTSNAFSSADPHATTVLPVNASDGRFVIECWEFPPVDTRRSSQDPANPSAIYVAAQLEIR